MIVDGHKKLRNNASRIGIEASSWRLTELSDKRWNERVLLHVQLGGLDEVDRQAVRVALDNGLAGAVLMQQLDALGLHDVGEVADGATAITYCRQRHYDLILTDLNMAGMRGSELLARLRQIDVATPVVLVSASAPLIAGAGSGPGRLCRHGGKPLSIPQLAALLGKIEHVALAAGLAAAIPLWVQAESMLTHALVSRDTRRA